MPSKQWTKFLFIGLLILLTAALGAGAFLMGDINADPAEDGFTAVILLISAWYLLFVIWGVFVLRNDRRDLAEKTAGMIPYLLPVLFVTALAFRIIIGLAISGYPTDMACWTSWSSSAAGKGLFSIYQDAAFLDYPPGYIYILHILGNIGKLAGIECYTPAYNLLMKAPAILADMGIIWLLYRLGARRLSTRIGFVLAMLYAISPLSVIDSSAWGQIDSILALITAGYLISLYRRNIVGAAILFVVGILVKPQMLFFGPVLAVVWVKYISEKGWGKGIKAFFISLFSGAALFAAAVIPFTGGQKWNWIFDKYMGAVKSYNYITLNSANVFGLAGMNWLPTDTVKAGLPLGTWGIIGLAVTVLLYFVLAFINKKRDNLFMLSAMLMTGIYAFGLKMHERYLFPVIVIMLAAYAYDRRDVILASFGFLSTAIFINVAQVLAMIHIPPGDLLFRITSAAVILSYAILVVFCTREAYISNRDSKVDLRELSDVGA